jgi:Skp family chaperone for outer membrane proteins
VPAFASEFVENGELMGISFKAVWRGLLCAGLVVGLACGADADETKKQKGARKAPAPTQRFLNGIELTAEQKEKVAALDKELAAESQKITKMRAEILTETQKSAEKDAQKAAKSAGKTPAETKKSVDEALKLTDEQKEKMKSVQQAQQAFAAKAIEGLKKILTPEQAAKLPRAGGAKGKGGKKKQQ